MTDRETAIQWAKDAGFLLRPSTCGGDPRGIEKYQALITRAKAEAFEQAADAALKQASCTYITEFDRGVNRGALSAYEAIRALKGEK